MNKRVTIADIAKEAGVSMMTVSRAINQKEGISEETRQRILSIADQIGYRPSGVARALATNRSCAIGLVIPDVTNPFFAQIARGAEDIAHAAGYGLFLVNTDENAARETNALDLLLEKQVDGVILCSSRLPQPQLREYVGHFPHVVLINRSLELPAEKDIATFNVDDHSGAKIAIAHFVDQGHTHIGLIAGPEGSNSAQQRLEGYIQGLQCAGIPYDAAAVERCSPDTEGGHQAIRSLLNRKSDITAVLAFNDLVAVGVVQACNALGVRVPEDIAVIGMDDIPLAALVRPRLSTLRIEKRALGRQAMSTLLALIGGEEQPPDIHQLIQPTLILRDTTTNSA